MPMRSSFGSQGEITPHIGFCMADGWARRCATDSLRRAGAAPEPVVLDRLNGPCTWRFSALVYDLNPWNRTAELQLHRLRSAAPEMPLLLYLPPTGAAFSTVRGIPAPDAVQLQVQSRDTDSLRKLDDAMRWLIRSIPRTRVMELVSARLPRLPPIAYLFGHRVLTTLSAGHRPKAATIARALGISPRTLERRFARDDLPAPKAFMDWLTLLLIAATVDCFGVSPTRAGANTCLSPNDVYRLRRRLLGKTGTRQARTNGGLLADVERGFAARAAGQ